MTRTSILFLALCAILTGCGITHVDAGNIGIEVDSCSGGGVKEIPVGVGYHFTGPCTSIAEYATFQQTLILTKSPHEGPDSSPTNADDSINVTSSEGLPIGIDVSLSFTMDPSKAPAIYKKYRKDLAHIQEIFFRQMVREALQETAAKYTAQQLYSDKREAARAEVQGLLTAKLGADGFNVTQFTINETRVPAEVAGAIKAKVAMVQEAQRAEQQVKKTQAEAQQRIAQAEGEAQAARLRADAEAYTNQKLASSLSPVLVEYLKVQKWNGTLPTVQGGSTPLLNLGGSR